MKTSVFLLAACVVAAWPLPAQTSAPTPTTVHPDSPARANPRAGATPRGASGDDPARSPRGPLDWERTAALSPDGRLFVTRSLDHRLRVWDLASGKSAVELPAGVFETVFSPDGRLVACHFEAPPDGHSTGYWQLFNAADGKPASEPLLSTNPDGATLMQSVCFSPDGKWLAELGTVYVPVPGTAPGAVDFLGNPLTRVVLWDVAGGKLAAAQPVHEIAGGNAVVFSPDGKILAALGTGVALLGVPDLKPLRFIDLKAPSGTPSMNAAAFSPDGKLLAMGGDGRRVQGGTPAAFLCETATGRLVADLKFPASRKGRVRQVTFADNGRAVATATGTNAQAWSAADGRLLADLVGGSYPLAVSADGGTLAGSQSPNLALWDTAAWRLGLKIPDVRAGDGTENGTSQPGPAPLVFTPDGTGVVTLRRNSVAAWELASGKLRAECKATQVRGKD